MAISGSPSLGQPEDPADGGGLGRHLDQRELVGQGVDEALVGRRLPGGGLAGQVQQPGAAGRDGGDQPAAGDQQAAQRRHLAPDGGQAAAVGQQDEVEGPGPEVLELDGLVLHEGVVAGAARLHQVGLGRLDREDRGRPALGQEQRRAAVGGPGGADLQDPPPFEEGLDEAVPGEQLARTVPRVKGGHVGPMLHRPAPSALLPAARAQQVGAIGAAAAGVVAGIAARGPLTSLAGRLLGDLAFRGSRGVRTGRGGAGLVPAAAPAARAALTAASMAGPSSRSSTWASRAWAEREAAVSFSFSAASDSSARALSSSRRASK